MRHDEAEHVGEMAVAVVAKKLVGVLEVVVEIEVGPPVVVVVPPHRGVPLRLALDAGGVGDVGERAVVVVVIQVIALTVGSRLGVEQVGLDVDVEPAVAVVVRPGAHAAGIVEIEARGMCAFRECAIALVEVEQVGRREPADVKVKAAVIVDVDECRALLPGVTRTGDTGLGGDVLEGPVPEIAIQVVGAGLADDEHIRPPVAVIVADRDPGADRAQGKLAIARGPHPRVGIAVHGRDAGLFRRQRGKHRRSARTRARREWRAGHARRQFSGGGGRHAGGQGRECQEDVAAEVTRLEAEGERQA